jgi:hypothetical protein
MKTIAAITIGVVLTVFSVKTEAQVGVGVQISVAPPVIPVYEQPPCPYDGWMWTPGYWAYGDDGYYWVPGVWVAVPEVGFLWTPGYWGFDGGYYLWHRGYWGPHVGFYGGINYGWGYGGRGFYGGRWEGGSFRYNTTVWHVNNQVIHNTYNERPAEGPGESRASFNGKGGVSAAPSPAERTAMEEHHAEPTSAQQSHEQAMSKDRNQLASVNKGKPATTAMSGVNGDRFNSGGHAISKSAEKPAATTNHAAHTSSITHAATHQSQQHASSHQASQQQSAHTTQQHANTQQSQPQQHTSSHQATQQHANTHQSQPQQHMSSHQATQQQHQNSGMQQRSNQNMRPQQQHMAPPQQHMEARPAPAQHQGGGGGREGGGHRLNYMPMRVLMNE